MGKFYVFGAAIKIGYVGLAIIAVLNSVLSFYYYLRVVVVLYMFEKSSNDPCDRFSLSAIFALAIAVAGTLLLGVAPGSLMAAAMAAAAFIP